MCRWHRAVAATAGQSGGPRWPSLAVELSRTRISCLGSPLSSLARWIAPISASRGRPWLSAPQSPPSPIDHLRLLSSLISSLLPLPPSLDCSAQCWLSPLTPPLPLLSLPPSPRAAALLPCSAQASNDTGLTRSSAIPPLELPAIYGTRVIEHFPNCSMIAKADDKPAGSAVKESAAKGGPGMG